MGDVDWIHPLGNGAPAMASHLTSYERDRIRPPEQIEERRKLDGRDDQLRVQLDHPIAIRRGAFAGDVKSGRFHRLDHRHGGLEGTLPRQQPFLAAGDQLPQVRFLFAVVVRRVRPDYGPVFLQYSRATLRPLAV